MSNISLSNIPQTNIPQMLTPPGYDALPTDIPLYAAKSNDHLLISAGRTTSSQRPDSDPGTRVYYELFSTSPSGPLSSRAPTSGVSNRSYVILEEITPPRTWGNYCARVAAQENIHPSRLTVYRGDGSHKLSPWEALSRTAKRLKLEDVTQLEEYTNKLPFPIKCYLGEDETPADAHLPRAPPPWSFRHFISWWCCAPEE